MPGPNDAFDREPAEGGRAVVENQLEKQKTKPKEKAEEGGSERNEAE
jgi:hypothetical protein